MAYETDPVWTDFSRYPHEELIRALSASNPTELVGAGETWALIASALQERAEDLAVKGDRLADGWSGTAAENYRMMMIELVDGVRRLGAAAAAARDLVYAAADALAVAWNTMPPVSGEAARRQAVLIMAELAERYLEVAGELNETMSRLLPGSIDPVSGRPVLPSIELVFGDPSTGVPAHGQAPLFGRMLPAGLAAAGAVLGRPFVPSLLTRRPGTQPYAPITRPPALPVKPSPELPTAARPAALPAPISSGSGGSGSGGSGSGGISGGGSSLPSIPEVHAGPAGHSASSGPAGIAAATAGSVAARSGFTAPPMMPMGMMGAGNEGGTSRRLPAWLVETENVWGEATPVTSSVIGEDADATWW